MLDICLCELDVPLRHLEVCVTEEGLEGKDVSSGSKELDLRHVGSRQRLSQAFPDGFGI